jgi:hypothetical protein
MAIIATNSGSGTNFEPIPAGSYAARCYSMIHIGTNEETILGTVKRLNKVRITWELPTETKVFKEKNGEQPYVLSKEFTLSMHEKANLRKFLQSWRGKTFTEKEAESFDISVLLGKPCLISVNHKQAKNGNTYAEIAGVNLLPKGMECPPQINESQELTYSNFNQSLFDSLPDFLKDKITTSDEYKLMTNPNSHEDSFSDDGVLLDENGNELF